MMDNNIKIATWNLCLGLANKRDSVTRILNENKINICCLQETEVPMNYPESMLNTGNFTVELETNDLKKRAGIYLKKT